MLDKSPDPGISEKLPTLAASPMLLDELMPDFDATRIEHEVVDASTTDTYRAVLEVDFIQTWKDSIAMRALFAARGAAEEVVTRLRGHELPPMPDLPSMRLADMGSHGQYVRLAQDPPNEIAFGMIGRFWAGETDWRTTDAGEFAEFAEPGLAKIACNFSLRPYGAARTLLSYEARTKATDEESRRQFLRYWRAVSPGVGLVMRSMLNAIEARAEA